MKRSLLRKMILLGLLFVWVFLLQFLGVEAGQKIVKNASAFSFSMVKVLPCAFILIGLFETWVKEKTVERHFGEKAGLAGHLSGVLLAGTTVGGLYVAFPVAASLYRKGARLAVLFTYLGASAVVRIPMTLFEATFMGLKFSFVRFFVSLALVIVSSEILGRFLEKKFRILKEA